MKYLISRDNRFYGNVPIQICNLAQIQVLDISRNNLSGALSRCFTSFTSLLQKNGTIDNFIDLLQMFVFAWEYVRVKGLDAYVDYTLVQWKGQELEYRKTLGLLKLINFSSNKLFGNIPRQLLSLRVLISLNLSRNGFHGNIHPDIGHMEMLESLDLSRNNLFGAIPANLAQLHYLQVLDLSYNNLSGKIPTSTQLQSFHESTYVGNAQLCGLLLALCPGDALTLPVYNPGENDEESNWFMSLSFLQDLGISMAFDLIFGFWGFIGSLLLKRSWRIAYCNFFGNIGGWMYVKIAMYLAKFKSS